MEDDRSKSPSARSLGPNQRHFSLYRSFVNYSNYQPEEHGGGREGGLGADVQQTQGGKCRNILYKQYSCFINSPPNK